MDDHKRSAPHAFIQAGGRSARMGTDKAWIKIAGHPMIEQVLAAAAPVAASLSIIIHPANSNPDRYRRLAATWKARLLKDLHDYQGPLGGIHTALTYCEPGESALILACDLPFLTTEFLAFLSEQHLNRGPQVTVPLAEDGRLQPLAAIYAQSCLAAIEQQMALGELKVDQLYGVVRTERIGFQQFAHLPGARRVFLNVNTVQDQRDASSMER